VSAAFTAEAFEGLIRANELDDLAMAKKALTNFDEEMWKKSASDEDNLWKELNRLTPAWRLRLLELVGANGWVSQTSYTR